MNSAKRGAPNENNLEGYYIDNTKEVSDILEALGYKTKDSFLSNWDYYKKYPFLVVYNGEIIHCHKRHLDRDDLYGTNKKLSLIDGNLFLPLTNVVKERAEPVIGESYMSGDRTVEIFERFKSLFVGRDTETGETASFYNTGECTTIGFGWLHRIRERK